jgi:hypothetical protein
VAVGLVAAKSGADGLDRIARENGDAVVGLLCDSCALVSELAKCVGGELRALEFLKQEDVGRGGLEPVGDMAQTGANRIHVPASDANDGAPICVAVSL